MLGCDFNSLGMETCRSSIPRGRRIRGRPKGRRPAQTIQFCMRNVAFSGQETNEKQPNLPARQPPVAREACKGWSKAWKHPYGTHTDGPPEISRKSTGCVFHYSPLFKSRSRKPQFWDQLLARSTFNESTSRETYLLLTRGCPKVDPDPKSGVVTKRSHRNSVQNGPIERSTALTGVFS